MSEQKIRDAHWNEFMSTVTPGSIHAISFKKFIILLAGEAGDADTNCAVAGATMNAFLGYSALPRDWIEALPNRTWFNDIIMNYIQMLSPARS